LNKVHQSLYKVKIGIRIYERDSVLFDEIKYSWPLLAGLMMAAAKLSGKINVLDFGGSLGSTYFQNKKFLDRFDNVKWNVVEQENFVKIGKKDFEDDRLKFFDKVNDCAKEHSPNILILSSVIQYIERPYELLESLISETNIDYILVDRTPFTNNDERIVIQTVPSSIYKASYPCHIFNLSNSCYAK
jgi:putative methyltransferase (TIGR04325 family)